MDAVYTHGHHESVLRSHRWRTAENSAAYLLPHLRPGDDACWTSAAGRAPSPPTWPRRVGAGSPASEVTERGAGPGPRRDRGRAAWTTSTSPSADVHALDFPDDTFDVVHAHQVLQHVGDPVQALREMRRVTQAGRDRGGARQRLRRVHLVSRSCRSWTSGWTLYQRVARANGGEPDAGRRLLAWARAAGFDEVTATSSHLVLRHPRGPGLVGRHVGGPHPAVGHGGAGPGRPAPPPRTTCGASPGLAALGRRPRRLAVVLHGEILCRA